MPKSRKPARILAHAESFGALVANIADYAIFLLDPAGTVLTWNRGARAMKGYAAREIVGRHFSVFYPPEDAAAGKPGRELARALKRGRVEEEGWLVRKDGTRFWANTVLTPLRGPRGKLLGFVKLTRDLTGRKRAEAELRQSEERFRTVVEAAPNAIVMVGRDGRIVLVNARTEKLFGYAREELLGQTIELLVPARFRERHPGYRHGFFAEPRARPMGAGRDLFGLRKDGREVPVEIGLNPIATREGAFVLASIIDITERKQGEAMRAAKEAVEAANRELETFSYSVAHDLRAPLRKVAGFALALAGGLGARATPRERDYLKRIEAGVLEMDGIITGFLELSKLLQREPRREPVDLGALAAEIAEELRASDPGRRARFVIEPGLRAEGDEEFLRIVLRNLLGNAWKFTSKHAEATIEFGSSAGERGPVYFVKDDGAGFDMAYRDKLFGVFKRLHAPGEFPGSGIGLATVARVLQRHGGRIWAEGAVEKGATFYFTLGHA